MTRFGTPKIKGLYYDEITFVYKNGETYTFKTEPNPLNTSQMWWFEPLVGMNAGTVKEAKIIAKNIRKWKKGEFKPEKNNGKYNT